jgi:hypothetical protein
MFFVDDPYVSDFLKRTLLENQLPLVATPAAGKFSFPAGTRWLSEAEAIRSARETTDLRIYTNSENTIGWIAEHLAFTGIPEKIDLFKNKAKFRRLIAPLYPHFAFREAKVEELRALDFADLPVPCVLKPAVGFLSLGVHMIYTEQDWHTAVDAIEDEIESIRGRYPEQVVNIDSFVIEQCIEGDEFAVDAYYNNAGEVVVLDILHHTFASAEDVSDRIYTTSKAIIEANLADFSDFLGKIGKLARVRNFPVHVELRRTAAGEILPIEVNPMRFGGWCSTPDLAYLAYGLNPYLYYIHQQAPDWDTLLRGKENKLYSVVILDNSTGKTAAEIKSFDYDACLTHFEKPLELRKIDYHRHGIFAFLFVETRADATAELDYILHSRLNEFITC